MRPSIRPATCGGSDWRTTPSASITALIPVVVERRRRQPFLHRAQPRLGEMLRRTPAAEPAIVGRIEDVVRALGRIDHLAREHDLVADLHAGLAQRSEIISARPRPRPEVQRARHQPRRAKRFEQPAQRQILAIRHQVRLGIARQDAAAPVDRGDRVAGGKDFVILQHQVDRAGQQHAVRPDYLPQPLAGQYRVGGIRHLPIQVVGIAITQVVGEARLGPQHQPPVAPALRQSQPRHLDEVRFEIARIVQRLLSQVGLDQGEADLALLPRKVARRQNHLQGHGQRQKHQRRGPTKTGIAAAFPSAAPATLQAGGDQYEHAGQAICSGPGGQNGEALIGERTEQGHAQRVPSEAGEQPAAHPLGDDPAAGQRDAQDGARRSAAAPPPPERAATLPAWPARGTRRDKSKAGSPRSRRAMPASRPGR